MAIGSGVGAKDVKQYSKRWELRRSFVWSRNLGFEHSDSEKYCPIFSACTSTSWMEYDLQACVVECKIHFNY